MKKIIALLLLFFFGGQVCYSNPVYDRLTATPMGTIDQLKAFGLVYYNDVRDNLDAEFSTTTASSAYTATRNSSNPASTRPVDTGKMGVTTATGAPRHDWGYQDETGWHNAKVHTQEGSATNLLIRTDGTASINGLWTDWGGYTGSGSFTTTQVSAADISSIADSYAQRMQLTGTASTGNARLASPYAAVSNGQTITTSISVKTQTTSKAGFDIFLAQVDANGKQVTYAAGSKNITLTSGYGRYHKVWSIANATGSISTIQGVGGTVTVTTSSAHGRQNGSAITISGTTNYNGAYTVTVTGATTFTFSKAGDIASESSGTWTQVVANAQMLCGYGSVSNGDTVDFTAYAPQMEVGAYPSTWIPTSTTTKTRNGESLSIPTPPELGVNGNSCLSLDGINDKITFGSWGTLSSGTVAFRATLRNISGGAWRGVLCASNGGSDFQIFSYGDGKLAFLQDSFRVDTTTNVPHDFVITWGNGNFKAYIDNVLVGTAGDLTINWSAPQFGEYTGGAWADMIVYKAVVLNRVITETERANPYALSNRTGIVAEYKFTDGTGTTLTDSSGNANNGTISGPTWTKDSNAQTWVFKYRPRMLPNEQPTAGYSDLLKLYIDANNWLTIFYQYATGTKYPFFEAKSNGNLIQCISTANESWERMSEHLIIATCSTASFKVAGLNSGNSIKMAFWDCYLNNGVLTVSPIAYSTTYVPPVGALPATIGVQTSAGQSAGWEKIALFNQACDSQQKAVAIASLMWN